MERTSGICGQAPSNHSTCAQLLVEQDREGISPQPDAVLHMLLAVATIDPTYTGAC